jgi:hypothetical protein
MVAQRNILGLPGIKLWSSNYVASHFIDLAIPGSIVQLYNQTEFLCSYIEFCCAANQ